ncbi:MAG: hypothetical protein AAF221_04200 [Pseudomonadota bacterium]
MKLNVMMTSACLVLASCGGSDDPITIEEIAEEPGRKDVAMLCDLYVQRLSQKTDRSAEAGFKEMARLGVSEKGVEKARESREEGREDYVDGVKDCCKAFNKDVKELNDTQIAYVYSDMVLSSITSDMLTPAQIRAGRALRKEAEDNMTRPQSNAAYDVRRSLPKCEKVVSNRVSKDSADRIREIMEEFK